MLSGIKDCFRTWLWSAGVLARCPLYVLAIALISAGWGIAAYEWLWLPESSALVLLLALICLLALVALAVAFLAAMTTGVSAAAAGIEQRLRFGVSLRFGGRRFVRTLSAVAIAALLISAVVFFFGWLNDHEIEIASFLTLHLRTPVSYVAIGRVLWVIEALLWIAIGGMLMIWFLGLLDAGWKHNGKSRIHGPAHRGRALVFLTGLVATVLFGGGAWQVATWQPVVKPGFWDYTQLAVRAGAALILISFGWLFWTLSLARLRVEPVKGSTALPTPS